MPQNETPADSSSSASKNSPTEDLPTPAGLPDDLEELAVEEEGTTDPSEIKPNAMGSDDPTEIQSS